MGDDKDREALISLTQACLSPSSGNWATLMPSPGKRQSGICVGLGNSGEMAPSSGE